MSAPATGTDQALDLYLDLLKRTLTGAVAEDNDSILGGVRTSGSPLLRKRVADSVGRLVGRFGFELAYKKPFDARAAAQSGATGPRRADSMIGLRRMDNIQHCIEAAIRDEVPGDLIETGVWRGGATIFMRGVAQSLWRHGAQGLGRRFLRRAAAARSREYPADAGDTFHEKGGLAVGVDQVRHNFERYGLLDDQVEFLVGWFKDTLPTAPIEQLAVMRLDGDMYESTWQAIEALYPKLSPGGFCIVDDYGDLVAQCQRAIHDYRDAHGITEEIVDIDGFGAYWRKSS